MSEKKKPIKMWGGFYSGKLHVRLVDSGHGGWGRNFTHRPAIFLRKTDALREYEDVRELEIYQCFRAEGK